MNIQSIRQKYEQKIGKRDQITSDLNSTVDSIKEIEIEIGYTEKAQAVIIAVARATQNELEYRITEPISLALGAVYENNPYKMSAKFEITGRGTTECKLAFERNGNFIKPLEASGGGPVDIASFALRVGGWSLSQPRSRSVLILDEPFKWVSRDRMPLAGQMLQEISKQLGLQIIMISHIPELIECSSRVIEIEIQNGISSVKSVISKDK